MRDSHGKELPGISVSDHCVNVGFVAAALIELLPKLLKDFLPRGVAALVASHDIGKISTGFQSKCRAWLEQTGLSEIALREGWQTLSEGNHAKVSQYHLQDHLKSTRNHLWSVAAGAHHGQIFGSWIPEVAIEIIPTRVDCEKMARAALLAKLTSIFGPLPATPPAKNHSDLWFVAGLTTVADWIGSNERFFPADRGLSLDESREAAERALGSIGWRGGSMRKRDFAELFDGKTPTPLQAALHARCDGPGLFIVEGPMGCGKTEAALWAAHRLIESGANDGLFFALPTQVTSNRIHKRVTPFLESALADAAILRLAHSASWLEEEQTMRLRPADPADPDSDAYVREGRSWFASSKHSLLARFGVGTVDQALQGVVAVKHFFVRRFGLAGKVVILDEVHSYDVYTGTLITQLIRELLALRCSVIVLSATLTAARRRELVAALDVPSETAQSLAYPLVTTVRAASPVVELAIELPPSRDVKLRTAPFTEDEILAECIERAESGQHVLYLRNTVAEAQETCGKIVASVREGTVKVATLHSRFPFFRRQELEDEWLERLGKQRAKDGTGSLLIATQVVEQSVDIDLDFIVSDLAPTDMLLQRMGRLWRHERGDRLASAAEFWINAPMFPREATVDELRRAFGKSGRVYAPYVLLRTGEVFSGRESISLPGEIREVLEATYAEKAQGEEPNAWMELRAEVERERNQFAAEAQAATRVLGRQSEDDTSEHLTRRKGAPTRDVALLHTCERIGPHVWRLKTLDGDSVEISGFDWSFVAARALYRNLVRVPLHTVPPQPMPPWLKQHTHGLTAWALVNEKGELIFPDADNSTALAYHSVLGLCVCPSQTQHRHLKDDDEFD